MIEKVKFKDLDDKIKADRCSVLFLVSPEKNPDDEKPGQFESVLGKINSLPEDVQDKIFSYKIGRSILEIGKSFNLQLLQIADIARTIRGYYFGEIKLEDFQGIFIQELQIDSIKAKDLAGIIIKNIIQARSAEQSQTRKLPEKLPIAQAIQKYPRVGEQLITASPIKLKIFPTPVRPSIKNWIADYHQTLGPQKHGVMERGNYLYHSENAKKLSPGERQKLAIILKSLDESEPVTINSDQQEAVFAVPLQEEYRREKNANLVSPQMKPVTMPSEAKIKFSSGQRMPLEQAGFGERFSVQTSASDREISEADWQKEEIAVRDIKGAAANLKEAWQKDEKIEQKPLTDSGNNLKRLEEIQSPKMPAARPEPAFREAWEKKEEIDSKQQQARTSPMRATEKRFWRNVNKFDYKPFRITPFGFDPSESFFLPDKDNLEELADNKTNGGNVVNLKNIP